MRNQTQSVIRVGTQPVRCARVDCSQPVYEGDYVVEIRYDRERQAWRYCSPRCASKDRTARNRRVEKAAKAASASA